MTCMRVMWHAEGVMWWAEGSCDMQRCCVMHKGNISCSHWDSVQWSAELNCRLACLGHRGEVVHVVPHPLWEVRCH